MHHFNEHDNLTRINRSIDMTFSHTHRIFNDMKEAGVITITKRGRENFIRLTPQGRQIRDISMSLRDKFKEVGVIE